MSEERPERLRDRIDAIAASALSAIPYVGDGLSHFFTRIVVPTLSPPRDRLIDGLGRGLRRLEGRASTAIMRLMPMPPPLPRRRPARATSHDTR